MSPTRNPARMWSRQPTTRLLVNRLTGTVAALGAVVLAVTLASGGVSGLVSGVTFAPHAPDVDLFLRQSTAVKVHLLAALGAVALGAVLMGLRKGRRFHRLGGWTWAGLMGLTAVSSLFITGINGDSWSLIHLLAGWTILSLPFAVMAARRHKVKQHRSAMMGMFYGGVLLAGALAFIPGRLMWELLLG